MDENYEHVFVLGRGEHGFRSSMDLQDVKGRKHRRNAQGWAALTHKAYRPLGTPDLQRERKNVERLRDPSEEEEKDPRFDKTQGGVESGRWDDEDGAIVPGNTVVAGTGNGFNDLKREVMESEERMLGVRGGSTFMEMLRRQERLEQLKQHKLRLPNINGGGSQTDRPGRSKNRTMRGAPSEAVVGSERGGEDGPRPGSMGGGSQSAREAIGSRGSTQGSPSPFRRPTRPAASPSRGGGTPRKSSIMPDIPALRAPRNPNRPPAADQFPVGGGRGLMPPPRFGLSTGPQALELDPAVTVQERLVEFEGVRSDMNRKLNQALGTLQTERTDNYRRKFVSFRVQREHFNPVRWRLQAERYKIEAQLHAIESHPWYSRLVHMVTENGRTMSGVEQEIVIEVKTVVEMGREFTWDHFFELSLKLSRDAMDNTEVQKVMNFLREEIGLPGEEYKKFLQNNALPVPYHLKREGTTKAATMFNVARGLVRAGMAAQERMTVSSSRKSITTATDGGGAEGGGGGEGGAEGGAGGGEGGAAGKDGEVVANFQAHFGTAGGEEAEPLAGTETTKQAEPA